MKFAKRAALAAGIAALLVIAGCFMFVRADVTGADARKLVGEGALLVDVRGPEEYAAGHIDGAVNVSVGDLPQRLMELGPKDKPLVLYCQHGVRATKAADILRKAGFTEVHNLGAISNW
jgi:phage shock protein E